MAQHQDQGGTIQRNQNTGKQGTEKDNQNRPSNENSPSSEERRYSGGAPDSSRQFGEAKGSIRQPGITNPTDDDNLNPAGQPFSDAGDEVPSPSRSPKQPSPSRTPARGPGIPPSNDLGDEGIESLTTPMNDTGRIEPVNKIRPASPLTAAARTSSNAPSTLRLGRCKSCQVVVLLYFCLDERAECWSQDHVTGCRDRFVPPGTCMRFCSATTVNSTAI
jgi:hypothetical protein